jgi:hypothetical protein
MPCASQGQLNMQLATHRSDSEKLRRNSDQNGYNAPEIDPNQAPLHLLHDSARELRDLGPRAPETGVGKYKD